MMAVKRSVLDVLEEFAGGLCDASLLKATGLSSNQVVNGACRALEREGKLSRESGECIECGKSRILNRLLPATEQTERHSELKKPPQRKGFSVAEMDELRRDLIQLLNRIEPSSTREGFSKRVVALRNEQRLSSTTASLMLTHAAFRNDLYYNKTSLSEGEQRVLVEIDRELRVFLQNL